MAAFLPAGISVSSCFRSHEKTGRLMSWYSVSYASYIDKSPSARAACAGPIVESSKDSLRKSTGRFETFSSVSRSVDLPDFLVIATARNALRQSYFSPLYSMTAPCMSELHRMRSKGCSGTTVHSRNLGMVRLLSDDATRALFLLPDFLGRDSKPLYLVRPDSHATALRRRNRCSSSSAVARGSKNSREAPPGA